MSPLRFLATHALRLTARDIHIQHHWVPEARVKLNSYAHKGYWYLGKKREQRSMELSGRLVKPGMLVGEVGGHIGYLSVYFASLVGPSGQVVVFEPGSNNFGYTISNLGPFKQVQLLQKGVGDKDGSFTFYEDTLSGQNNSFLSDEESILINQQQAVESIKLVARGRIDMVKLDTVFKDRVPDFLKIDAERFELSVLKGAAQLLATGKPVVMIEVTNDGPEVLQLLADQGYAIFDEAGQKQSGWTGKRGNYFCLPKLSKLDPAQVFAA